MAAHQRTMPLLRLLARSGWQHDPDLWTVRCWDGHGRRARMRVHLSPTGASGSDSRRRRRMTTPTTRRTTPQRSPDRYLDCLSTSLRACWCRESARSPKSPYSTRFK